MLSRLTGVLAIMNCYEQVFYFLCLSISCCNIVIDLGSYLASKKIEVVYGGGMFGVMGKMAQSVMDGDGKITGIIPKFFTGDLLVWLSHFHLGLFVSSLVQWKHSK